MYTREPQATGSRASGQGDHGGVRVVRIVGAPPEVAFASGGLEGPRRRDKGRVLDVGVLVAGF